MKNVWIVKVGEYLPFDSKRQRLLRSATLAHELNKRGYNVTFFVDEFNHFTKKKRVDKPKSFHGVDYVYLGGIFNYRSNKSLKRFVVNFIQSISFVKHIILKRKNKPDVIIISFPTISLSLFGIIIGKLYRSKTIIDIRDAWPDIWFEKGVKKQILRRVYKPILKYIFENAQNITACTPSFQSFVRSYTKEKLIVNYIPHTFYTSEDIIHSRSSKLEKQILVNSKIKLLYFGAISTQRSIGEFLSSFKEYPKKSLFEITLCGNGDLYEKLKKNYESKNVIFKGHVGLEEMEQIQQKSLVGIAPYILNEGYIENIPNKLIEYLYYGLPIIGNLQSPILFNLNSYVPNTYFHYSCKQDLFQILDTILIKKEDLWNTRINRSNLFDDEFSPKNVIQKFEKFM